MRNANQIADTGISVAYEAENSSPVVDIIIIHGLQGHPYKTWARTKVSSTATSLAPEAPEDGRDRNKNLLRSVIPRLTRKSSEKAAPNVEIGHKFSSVFWPADLLPRECPNSRILMYGYDTKVTKYMTGATNKNSIFSHSKDLLFAICRERIVSDRPLIFVAHSLGGIVVKEMLARSSASTETEFRNVVHSTAAVIFLGTPHRGSPDLAALGEWVRSVVSTLGMETTSAILNALGLKTTDLERAQEEFSRLWHKYDFRVKTFQEGLGMTGVNLGILGNKVVPDYSSLIGDQREHAETIEANHMDMCRFTGADDPNYRKVAGELRSIYLSIADLNAQKVHWSWHIQRRGSMFSAGSSAKIPKEANGSEPRDVEKAFLQSLWFPSMSIRPHNLEKPAEQTCLWLFEHETYQDWFNSRNRDKHYGLLWLKGKPGAGKSVLMKEAFRRAALGQAKSDYWTAAFFFNGKGDELEHSPAGLFRSLLYQLLPRHREHLQEFGKIWEGRKVGCEDTGVTAAHWQEAELMSFFQLVFAQQSAKRTLIFIDALDECDSKSVRSQAYFWREITKSAHAAGVDLNVCLSSRHFPSVTVGDCPEIIVENHNSDDIATYIEQKFKLGVATEEPQWELLRDKVLDKSAGVFLWVVLVVDDMLKKWDDGKGSQYLLKLLDVVPQELEALFSQMFLSLNPKARQLTVRVFQWAILAAKPLRLHEWHHILAFIRQPTPSSLHEWRLSDDFTENDDQLERQIRSISKGLVEVKTRADDPQDKSFETISVRAGAGSLDLEHGETRVVQVIHESVREFFLRSNGFSILDPNLESNPIGNGHFSITATCLDYLNITELDALVQARTRAEYREKAQPRRKEPRTAKSSIPSCSSHLSSIDIPSPLCFTATRKCSERSPPSHRRAEEVSVFERLKKSSNSAAKINIARWIATIQFVADQASLNESACDSTTHRSVTDRSQVLEDYPALLSYALFDLFTHAQLAEKEGADLSSIIDRLKEKDTWARWVILREDVPQGIELLSFAANQGLSTWVSNILDSGTEDQIHQSQTPCCSPGRKGKGSSHEGSDCHGSQYQLQRRRRSVASFSSAGSSCHGVNRDYILDLADPSRPNPNNSVPDMDEANASKRTQKHPATFQCSLCPKRFTRAYNLRSHLRTHTDERPFVCSVCGKAFARQHDRKRHEGLHSGEKKFICSGNLKDGGTWGCSRRFARADALGRHFRSEAGRVCIKPLLEEEALERMQQNLEQSNNTGIAPMAIPMNTGQSYMLPRALLAQYPTLGGIWNDFPIVVDDDVSRRNSSDASSAGEYDEAYEFACGAATGWSSDVGTY